jgi:signal transduction histidine kinase
MQAMDNGGLLTIRTRQTDGFYEVQIRDTGTGIPSEIMSEIFDPFFTTKAVGIGTGLGLSVSKSIIEQHGGVIEVESEVGVGTAFRVRLPVEQG